MNFAVNFFIFCYKCSRINPLLFSIMTKNTEKFNLQSKNNDTLICKIVIKYLSALSLIVSSKTFRKKNFKYWSAHQCIYIYIFIDVNLSLFLYHWKPDYFLYCGVSSCWRYFVVALLPVHESNFGTFAVYVFYLALRLS